MARRLRVLAYHGVEDADTFARQLAHLRSHYEPVAAEQVCASFRGAALPDRPVWVTFDDGLPSVIENGLPLLAEAEIPATIFVCPGLVESGEPNWWDVVSTAVAHGVPCEGLVGYSGDPVTALKSVPDDERRAIVRGLVDELRRRGLAVAARQLRSSELEAWRAAGNTVGNHSYDHPCLNRCSPVEQRRQVREADAWLRAHGDDEPRIFAYPNGNATDVANEELVRLGYDIALLFDHHVASLDQHPLRVSRLRVSSSASDARFAAIVSGLHSTGFHVKRRVFGGPADATATHTPDIDAENQRLYERAEAVREFTAPRPLLPCEQVLVDTYLADGDAVLDVGVGGGRTTAALIERAGSYTGIDYSEPMIEAARTRFPGVTFCVRDAADLGCFDDGAFDLVLFSFNGLDYLHPAGKRGAAIAELARVVRSGGTVIVSSHNSRAIVRPVAEHEGPTTARDRLVQAYSSARLAARALTSRPFRDGEGYVRDTASPYTNYASRPERVAAEFSAHGLAMRECVGSRYPRTLPGWMEPWYYYVFRRQSA